MVAKAEHLAQAEELKALFLAGDTKRDAGLDKHPAGIERLDDIPYGPDPDWHVLDIYRPKEAPEKLPVIVNIHGGGWVYGSKETYQFYGMSLAGQGFAFVNASYRLPPLVEFPAELDDINRVLHWLAENGAQYGLDLDNVFLVGDSAGGQMTLQYLTLYSNPDYRKLFGYDKPALTIRAAAFNCGAAFLDQPGMIDGAPQAYFTEDSLATQAELLKTEDYITQDLPPLYLMTATEDFLRDAVTRLDGFLLAKGVAHEFHLYGTPDDPRGHVFHCNVQDPLAKICNQDQLRFFREHLH